MHANVPGEKEQDYISCFYNNDWHGEVGEIKIENVDESGSNSGDIQSTSNNNGAMDNFKLSLAYLRSADKQNMRNKMNNKNSEKVRMLSLNINTNLINFFLNIQFSL